MSYPYVEPQTFGEEIDAALKQSKACIRDYGEFLEVCHIIYTLSYPRLLDYEAAEAGVEVATYLMQQFSRVLGYLSRQMHIDRQDWENLKERADAHGIKIKDLIILEEDTQRILSLIRASLTGTAEPIVPGNAPEDAAPRPPNGHKDIEGQILALLPENGKAMQRQEIQSYIDGNRKNTDAALKRLIKKELVVKPKHGWYAKLTK